MPVQEEDRETDRLIRLARATQSLGRGLDLDEVLQDLTDAGRELAGARYAAMGVLADDGVGLAAFHHSGLAPEVVARLGALPVGHGLLGLSGRRRSPVSVPDVATHDGFTGFPDNHPTMRTLLSVPVHIEGRLFGSLYVADRADGAPFDDEDAELLQALATASASAIEHARLFTRLTERERWLEASRLLSADLVGADGQPEALRLVTRRLREVSGADLTAVVAPDPSGRLVVSAADGIGAEELRGAAVPETAVAARALRSLAVLRVDAAEEHADVFGVPVDVQLGEAAVVPLVAHDQVVGTVVLGNCADRDAPLGDLDLVADFTRQAALVLVLAAARTSARELALSEERVRLARDLHDDSLQTIFGVAMRLNVLAGQHPEVATDVLPLVDDLDDASTSIRQTIYALQREGRPAGFRGDLTDLTTAASFRLGFPPRLRVKGPVDTAVSPRLAPVVLGVVEALLDDVLERGTATRVTVRVTVKDAVTVEVSEDGTAGAGAAVLAELGESAARAGGTCEAGPAERSGTRVRWSVPIPPAA